MQESLETQSPAAVTAINSFVRGSSLQLCASDGLGWGGVYLEHHRALPVERSDSVSPHHLVVLFTSHVSRGETSVAQARFVPYSFSPGTIRLYPAGPIGACRPVTDTTTILCALDPKLVAEVGEELGAHSTMEFHPIANLRDRSLEGIVTLLAAEANAGGVSGRLFVEHLARALAVRFRQLSGGLRDHKPSQSGKMAPRI